MKCVALREFHDREADAIRREGEVFEVTEGRFKELSKTAWGALVKKYVAKPKKGEKGA